MMQLLIDFYTVGWYWRKLLNIMFNLTGDEGVKTLNQGSAV